MTTYCGYIALIGRPNAGKSTLLNQILKTKLSITSRKPQTTRHRILGIDTVDNHQFIYVDTPGVNQGYQKAINRVMNKTAYRVLKEVDVVVFVVDAAQAPEEDDAVVKLFKQVTVPIILAINKIDKIKDKTRLLPLIETLSAQYSYAAVVPLSAKTGAQVSVLQETIRPFLPESPHFFGEDELTDRPVRFLCAEAIREKLFRYCGQELPYAANVEIEMFQEEDNLIKIHALILVEKENHKRMIIGDKGQKLKEISTQARLDMEKFLEKKVFLRCWCKVKAGWADDERMLRNLGYES